MRFLSLTLISLFFTVACTQEVSSGTTTPALDSFLKGSTKPAVIKFYADWCDSCQEYLPVFAKVQIAQTKSADFYSIDVDNKKYQALVRELKISRIPVTYFVTKDRQTVTKKLGPLSESDLRTSVQRLLI